MTRARHAAVATILVCGALACTRDDRRVDGGSRRTDAPDITIAVRDGAITMSDTVNAGWQRIRVTETGSSHIVVFFRLPDGSSESEVKAFLSALDSTANTPSPAIALGGPEMGTVGDVVLELAPGEYVVACVARLDADHRHANAGEARTVLVVEPHNSVTSPDPVAAVRVEMTDFAYGGSEVWPSGVQLIHVLNNGLQDHQLRIARLEDGVTLRQVMEADDPSSMMTGVAGVARMSAGREAFLPLELAPGNYLLSCLVADPNTRRPHAELGMVRLVRVE